MGILSKVRRAAWRTSSIAGDVQAATRGPGPAARRVARKSAYRTGGKATRKLLRLLGL